MKIMPLIGETETIAQAVRRYGAVAKQNKKRSKTVNNGGDDNEAYKLAKSCLDDLTGAANALLLKGEVDIYDTRRQGMFKYLPLKQQNQQGSKKAALSKEKQPPCKWEYMGNQDGKIHGPFTTEEMMGWMKAGYFVGLQKVKIRSIREKELSTEDDLMADLMDDDDDEGQDKKIELEKGDWQWSDEVNMQNCLP